MTRAKQTIDFEKLKTLCVDLRAQYPEFYKHGPNFQNDILAAIKKTMSDVKKYIRYGYQNGVKGGLYAYTAQDIFEFTSNFRPKQYNPEELLALLKEKMPKMTAKSHKMFMDKIQETNFDKKFMLVCIADIPEFSNNDYIDVT